MKNQRITGRKQMRSIALGIFVLSGSTLGGEIDLSDAPLYLVEGVAPNLFVTLDTTQSMRAATFPDSAYESLSSEGQTDAKSSWRLKSSRINKIYFDPDVTYEPGLDYLGNSLGNSTFTSAPVDPYINGNGYDCTVNLSSAYKALLNYDGALCTGGGEFMDDPEPEDDGSMPAYYYVFNASSADPGCDGSDSNDTCYERHVVGDVADPAEGATEKQNFANWFTYYRTRMHLTKTALSRVFGGLDLDARLAYQTVEGAFFEVVTDLSGTVNPFGDAFSTPSDISPAVLNNFFTWFGEDTSEGSVTALRIALQNAGEFAQTAAVYRDDPSVGVDEPTVGANPERACRKNYHILITDGLWDRRLFKPELLVNTDAQAETSIGTNDFGITAYSPLFPYKDGNTAFLADVAFHYWINDLRPDLADEVPASIVDRTHDVDGNGDLDNFDLFWNPKNDPATWQHLVNYTVGLGTTGGLDSTDLDVYNELFVSGFPGSEDGTASDAGSAVPEERRAEDMWHAAINSRGGYFSAQDPEALISAFQSIVESVVRDTGPSSASAGSVNSGAITTGSKIYQSRFDSGDWTGELIAYSIATGTDDSPCDSNIGELCAWVWEASDELEDKSAAERNILTFDGTDGVVFSWDSLTTLQQQALISGAEKDDIALTDADRNTLGAERLAYLRGDASNEIQNSGALRDRQSKLGDMINSSPLYVGPPSRLYPDEFTADDEVNKNYSDFKTEQANRIGMVYAGSNDGMLHAFDGATGEEKFAYIPNAVFPNLINLTDPNYSHANYVDGPVNEGDVYFGGDWHTVLVGALGLGGQGFYALDITNPGSVDSSSTQAETLALWEFTDADDADLGYTYGRPAIVRVNRTSDDTTFWAAVAGNGYNNTDGYSSATGSTPCTDTNEDGSANTDTPCNDSASGDAVLYVINIQTGAFDKISTYWGTDDDPLYPDAADAPERRPNGLAPPIAVDLDNDYIADFAYAGDLHGNLWKFNLKTMEVAFTDGSNNPVPMFSARDESGDAQPITQSVAVMRHPTGVGILVLFGTGVYLGQSDAQDTSTQTFYAIWDDGATHEGSDASKVGFTRGNGSSLLKQEVVKTDTSSIAGVDLRLTSNNSIDWSTHKGWYLDLLNEAAPIKEGERVHQPPQIRDSRLVFLTLTPDDDPCAAGGNSWVMALDARDGSRLGDSAFDTNRDGAFGSDDLVEVTIDGSKEKLPASGLRHDSAGIYSGPTALVLEGGETMDYVSTSGGDLIAIKGSSDLQWRVWKEIN